MDTTAGLGEGGRGHVSNTVQVTCYRSNLQAGGWSRARPETNRIMALMGTCDRMVVLLMFLSRRFHSARPFFLNYSQIVCYILLLHPNDGNSTAMCMVLHK